MKNLKTIILFTFFFSSFSILTPLWSQDSKNQNDKDKEAAQLTSKLLKAMGEDEERPIFKVQQLNENFDVKALPEREGVEISTLDDVEKDRREAKQKRKSVLPRPGYVKGVVSEHLPELDVKDWDALDYDQFFMRTKSWDNKSLMEKYRGLSDKKIELVRRIFLKHER